MIRASRNRLAPIKRVVAYFYETRGESYGGKTVTVVEDTVRRIGEAAAYRRQLEIRRSSLLELYCGENLTVPEAADSESLRFFGDCYRAGLLLRAEHKHLSACRIQRSVVRGEVKTSLLHVYAFYRGAVASVVFAETHDGVAVAKTSRNFKPELKSIVVVLHSAQSVGQIESFERRAAPESSFRKGKVARASKPELDFGKAFAVIEGARSDCARKAAYPRNHVVAVGNGFGYVNISERGTVVERRIGYARQSVGESRLFERRAVCEYAFAQFERFKRRFFLPRRPRSEFDFGNCRAAEGVFAYFRHRRGYCEDGQALGVAESVCRDCADSAEIYIGQAASVEAVFTQ